MSNSRGEGIAQRVYYDEMEHGRKCSAQLPTGHRIVIGDRVGVDRDGWRDKIGMYIGKDYTKGKLKIRFEEFGGALLLCYARELRWLSVVGSETPADVQD